MVKRAPQSRDSPPRAFAPAFARIRAKSPVEDEDTNYGTGFKYTTSGGSFVPTPTWNTYDSKTNTRTWTNPAQSEHSAQASSMMWDDWAAAPRLDRKSTGFDANIAPEVRQQFVDERYLMRAEYEPKTDFERRNPNLVTSSTSGQIISKFGDEEVILEQTVDDRAEHRDHNNNYIGKNRGLMPKRFEDELAKRRKERREEILRAQTLFLEWQAMTEEEKEERREHGRQNRTKVLERLEVEQEEAVPKIYEIDNDDLWKKIKDYKQAKAALAPKLQAYHGPAPSQVGGGKEPEALFMPLEDDNQSDLFLPADDDSSTTSDPNQRNAQRFKVAPRGPKALLQQGAGSPAWSSSTPRGPRALHGQGGESPAYSHQSGSFAGRGRGRGGRQNYGRYQPSGASTPSLMGSQTPTSTASRTVSSYKFETWPELLPIEDIPEVAEREYINEAVEFSELQMLCTQRGRMVVVSLVEQVEFTATAILDRIFGGPVQEIQFFPEDRMAMIAFISPLDAKAMLDHVAACQKESDHEYRRLQLHATFYKGTVTGGIWPSQEGILAASVVNSASRALKISHIHKGITREVLLHAFKNRFIDKHIVRVRLITPTKMYEREDILSNSAVIEFASIKQAIEVKALFDANGVLEFEKSKAKFLSDPVGARRPHQPFCTCQNCSPSRLTDILRGDSSYAGSEASYDLFGTESEASAPSTVGSAFLKDTRDLRLEGGVWDYEAEAKKPGEFSMRSSAPLKPKEGELPSKKTRRGRRD